jgi:hypothetical protein
MRSDRAELQLIADADVQRVLEFMQTNIPAGKLIGVANSIPEIARLLWTHHPQEPVAAIRLVVDPSEKLMLQSLSQSAANE